MKAHGKNIHTLNHFTSALALDTSHSKVTFSFSGHIMSLSGWEILAKVSVEMNTQNQHIFKTLDQSPLSQNHKRFCFHAIPSQIILV